MEPFRIGMTVVMINRPRPALQLSAFLVGGFVMGTAVGVIVLFLLRPAMGSAHFNLPKVQIVVGAVVLVNAALVATGLFGGKAGDGSAARAEGRFGWVVRRARTLLSGRSLWAAGIAGLGIGLPSIDYLAALALIVASGASAAVQFGALVIFTVVAFALVEIPLLCYLVAPDRTRATLSTLFAWMKAKGHLGVAALLAVVGCMLLGVGWASL